MLSGGIAQLSVAVDALAADAIDGPLGSDLRELQRLRARLDAEISRRVAAFDKSGEWAVDRARSAAAWLTRAGRVSAHREVKVARQLRDMPQVVAAWNAGEVATEHVQVLASARHAANAD